MHILSSKRAVTPKLRALAEDKQVVTAVTQDLAPILNEAAPNKVETMAPKPLLVSPQLPNGLEVSSLARRGKTDYETLEIIAQELILPAIGDLWPASKPYVKGVQAIWASKEFYDAITDKNTDRTENSIKGIKAAQKLTNAFLHFRGETGAANMANVIAGYVIATADQLYVVHEDAG